MPASEAEANALLQRGEVQFVVTIPSDFTRRLVRGERAHRLLPSHPSVLPRPLASPIEPGANMAGLPGCTACPQRPGPLAMSRPEAAGAAQMQQPSVAPRAFYRLPFPSSISLRPNPQDEIACRKGMSGTSSSTTLSGAKI